MYFLFQKNREIKIGKDMVLYLFFNVITIKEKAKICPYDLNALILIDSH